MKLVKALIWSAIKPLHMEQKDGHDEIRLEAAEMWCYRRMLRICWTEKWTNNSILDRLQTRREILAQINERKMAFFGHVAETISAI